MRKLSLLILSIISCSILIAQKTISDPNVQQRDLHGFHAIAVSNGIEVVLTQSNTEAVAVSAVETEDRDKITTIVENGILKISYEYDIWKLLRKNNWNKKLKAYVSVVNLDMMRISTGSYIRAEGPLKSPSLEMRVSSGAVFEGKIDAATIDINQSGGSRITISGSAKGMVCTGTSGSRFSGYDLEVDKCEIKTTSGAKIEVTVNGELSARVSSGGQVFYKGSGVIRNLRTSMGGNISRKS
jgi:hypothetical protein